MLYLSVFCMGRLYKRYDVQVKRTFIVTPTSLPSFPTVRRQIWTMATSVIKVSIFVFFVLSVIKTEAESVLRIRDVHPGSEFFPSRMPDPNFSIPDLGSASKNLGALGQKKLFLISRKYDLGCSSRIRILIFYPSLIPDPGVKKAPDPGFGSATLGGFGSGLTTKPVTRIC